MIFRRNSVTYDEVQTMVKINELQRLKKSQEEGKGESLMIQERPEKKYYKHKRERSKSRSKKNGFVHDHKKNTLKCFY